MSVTHDAEGVLIYTNPAGISYSAGGDNANCTISACPVELSVYGYRASLPFSATLIALYAICAIAQAYLGWRHRSWGFMAAMITGCFVEILGYVGRILMWQNPWGNSGFIMQIVLITIGPVFFSAAIYVMLSQIVNYIDPKSARFPSRLFYWIFIPFDIVSLVLQAVGGAMSSTSNGSSNAGVYIALAGLAFQVFTLVLFTAATVDYAFYSRKVWSAQQLSGKFKLFCAFLSAATLLILIRCSYRVYELSEGYSQDSEALRDQPLFIGLEGVMVVLAAWCLVVAHPGPAFSDRKNTGLKSDAEMTHA